VLEKALQLVLDLEPNMQLQNAAMQQVRNRWRSSNGTFSSTGSLDTVFHFVLVTGLGTSCERRVGTIMQSLCTQ
jgi:hypothetical protein